MTSARILAASTQTVHRGSSGASARAEFAAAQVVHKGVAAGRVRASFAVAQTVTSSLAGRLRESFAVAQVVHRGDFGAMLRETHGSLQVVYTTGVADDTRQRAWTFDFDGHTFYVLDLGSSGSLVYDLTTGQWSKFETAGYEGHWDMKNGFHWRTGKLVVGGQAGTGIIHRLVADSFMDEGWRPVEYEVRGVLPVGGIDHVRQYTLRLIGSAGVTADDIAPVLKMQFSDDQGVTWSAEHSIALKRDTRQRIEFRSLGAFTSPGLIFRLYDEGGVKFIAYVEADVGGENGRSPA